jgi:hypothetical protein
VTSLGNECFFGCQSIQNFGVSFQTLIKTNHFDNETKPFGSFQMSYFFDGRPFN